jgi:hypothetical protein
VLFVVVVVAVVYCSRFVDNVSAFEPDAAVVVEIAVVDD